MSVCSLTGDAEQIEVMSTLDFLFFYARPSQRRRFIIYQSRYLGDVNNVLTILVLTLTCSDAIGFNECLNV